MTNKYSWVEVTSREEYADAYHSTDRLEATSHNNLTRGDSLNDPYLDGGWIDDKAWPEVYLPDLFFYRRGTLIEE